MHDLALPTAIIAVENGRSVSQKPVLVEEGQVVRSTCLEADSRQYVQVDDGQSGDFRSQVKDVYCVLRTQKTDNHMIIIHFFKSSFLIIFELPGLISRMHSVSPRECTCLIRDFNPTY